MMLCDVGAHRWTKFLYSHNPAYRCLSRVPECVSVWGKKNVWLLMIVDTRDTVPYHSSCTIGCSWSQPTTTLKASILIWDSDVLPGTSLEGHVLAYSFLAFLQIDIISRVCVCVVNLQSMRKTGQLSFKIKTEQVGNSLPDSKGFPSGTCEANYAIGNINIWLLCTK